MVKTKTLLKKSINLGANALLLVSTLLPTLGILPTYTATAATTTGVGTVTPGSSWDTGNHTYSGQQNQTSNYSIGGNDNPSIAGNWLNLVNGNGNKVGYGIFNGSILTNSSIGTANAFKLSATLKIQVAGLLQTNFAYSGDALGFILTPSSAGQLASNIPNATGANLGIAGLANSYFLGRDMYSNLIADNGTPPGPDGMNGSNGWYAGASTSIAIRNTLAGGTLNPASYPNGDTPNTTTGQAWMSAPDDNYALGVDTGAPGTVQEPISMSWTPDSTNTAPTGFNSGTLTFNLIAQTTSNGAPWPLSPSNVNGGPNGYTLTTHCNLQDSMSIGFVGSTGGNYGSLSISLNGGSGTIGRGTEPAFVNYINSTTGKSVPSMTQQSTIIGNVNDVLGVLPPGSTATSNPATGNSISGTFNYVAPAAPAGYTYGSTNSITVANFQSGSTNPNVLNVQYNPKTESGQVGYWYLPGTPGTATTSDSYGHTVAYPSTSTTAPGYTAGKAANLPSGQAISGGTDTPISFTPSTIPAGYQIDHVIGPDNQSYPSFAAAIAANPNYTLDASNGGTNQMANSFVAILAPTIQSPTLATTFEGQGTLPANFSVNFQDASGNTWTAPTGSPIPTDIITATNNAMNTQVANYSGWYCASYIDPVVGNTATSLSEAVANASGVVSGNSNVYTTILNYQGTISLSVPSTIDFGSHTITGATQNLAGQMEDSNGNAQPVTVTDGRTAPNGTNLSWSLSVEQSQLITSSHGLSFTDSLMTYNGTAMTLKTPIVIGSDDNSSTGKVTEVIASDSKNFGLAAPSAMQVPNANYQGQVTWILATAP